MINKDRLIKLTQKVISYNSENPPGNELPLAKFIEKEMKSLGLEVKTSNYAKTNRPNIVATLKGTLPRKQAQAQAILLTPHFDTVPIGEGWKHDPLGGEIEAGKIYGRGATDDKGNLAASMEVMRSLVEDGVKLKKDVILAATSDEETGSHYGIIPLLKKKVLKPKLALVLDSEDGTVMVAQKGLIHGRVQIRGKRAHGAYNWLGENAIEVAARVIHKLKKMKIPYQKHKLLRPPTMNIGTISGGDKVNMVCDLCEFSIDVRFPPGTKSKDVLKQIRDVIKTETSKFKILIDDIQAPYEINPKHEGVQAYLKTAKEMKCKAWLEGSEGATVITFFQDFKIPAFSVGYGTRGQAHTTDEHIRINPLVKGTKLLEQYIKAYDEI